MERLGRNIRIKSAGQCADVIAGSRLIGRLGRLSMANQARSQSPTVTGETARPRSWRYHIWAAEKDPGSGQPWTAPVCLPACECSVK